jgi:hypothetical protein
MPNYQVLVLGLCLDQPSLNPQSVVLPDQLTSCRMRYPR